MLAPNMSTEIIIKLPSTYISERKYILDTIFRLFLGISYRIEPTTETNTITIERGHKKIIFQDILFQTAQEDWLTGASLPQSPLDKLETLSLVTKPRLTETSIPVIYGSNEISLSTNKLELKLDIFGSCFFMLTRYEEMVNKKNDAHDRFPSVESLSVQEDFLHRPIVNEYVELLWSLMHHLWPELIRKEHSFKITPTHDVDRPFKFLNMTYFNLIQYALEECLIRKNWKKSIQLLRMGLSSKLTKGSKDPYNTFDYIMETSESRGLQSKFYFLTTSTNKKIDGDYTLDDEEITQLIIQINKRKHILGIHPSYNSYLSDTQIKHESKKLIQHCHKFGIQQTAWGGRQHYLRFKIPSTWRYWNSANLSYDSSLYFADMPGFRAGCCYDFPVFDLEYKTELNLIEKPLILMESSFIDGLGTEQSYQRIKQKITTLKNNCKTYGGNFIILWHNSSLETKEHRQLYEFTLDC